MDQPAAKRRKTGTPRVGESIITDSRFANIQSDPRYRLPGKRQKIKVDKRFAKVLQDDDFARKAKVDRYGRPLETDSEKKRLKRKYEFEGGEDELEGNNKSDDDDDDDDDDEVQKELRRAEETRDLLRQGRDARLSEDEGSSGESSDEEEEDVDEVGPGVQNQDVPMGEVSSRLAVVNLDWDNIRAEDLMAVFQSFSPATGRLLKVTIYPSEFGKERMEREEMEGPPKEIFAKVDEYDDDNASSESEVDEETIKNSIIKPDDGSEFDSTALRQYQLDRLRYFYAVLVFSNSQTAKAIYDAVDGAEYLSTANFFDLRFIPDETDFSEDNPREECERIPPGYKPNDFVTDALQHSKVKLTWDAEDGSRKEAQTRAFRGSRKEIDENDLRAYLGSDSEDGENEIEAEGTSKSNESLSKKDAERQRMRALLGLAPEPVKPSKKDKKNAPVGNIQITFSSGLSGAAAGDDEDSDEGDVSADKSKKKRSVFENSPEPDETTMEKYVRKERERKQRRKEKMKMSREGNTVEAQTEADDATANPDDLGFDDPFFTEATLDAKSANKQRKEERVKRRKEREAEEAASAKQRAELESVMASVAATTSNDDPSVPHKGRTVKHFDMAEIEKAEKVMSKSKKAQKKLLTKNRNANAGVRTAAIDPEAVLAADDFTINTADPRFARLYEDHEFAIDPTNPRFKGTKGMKAMLEEVRKRKGKDREKKGRHTVVDRNSGGRGKAVGERTKSGSEEVMGLVEKIKRRQM